MQLWLTQNFLDFGVHVREITGFIFVSRTISIGQLAYFHSLRRCPIETRFSTYCPHSGSHTIECFVARYNNALRKLFQWTPSCVYGVQWGAVFVVVTNPPPMKGK
jgi:hypothetical protein